MRLWRVKATSSVDTGAGSDISLQGRLRKKRRQPKAWLYDMGLWKAVLTGRWPPKFCRAGKTKSGEAERP